MKLVKVEAIGFKSFADPISLKFDGGVAGIIGPNGSGKSNINDAIKWVLGERSAKELRGDNMEDVIFAGSKTAKAMNKAEVTLTFDNRDGQSNLPHQFITISRVLERGKGNTYYINGEICNLKDIKSIAMETGIGKSSLAIISQGTVSDIAEATNEERKAIFEEAAGVSKFKFQKREATVKLEKTQNGLDKVNAVIAEIEHNLTSLRKKAEKARQFIALKDQLKQIEVGLLVDRISVFGEQFSTLQAELEGVTETQTDLENKIATFNQKINITQSSLADENNTARELSIKIDELTKRIHQLEINLAVENERNKNIIDGLTKASAEEIAASYRELIESNAQKMKTYDSDIVNLNNAITEKEQESENILQKSNEVNILITKKATEITKIQTLLNNLLQQKENLGLVSKGTKNILENKAYFGKALKGTVADLIKVDNEYLIAINAILGPSVQNLVVDKSETAVKAVNFLKDNNGGRATFIPLTSIQPKYVRDDLLLAIQGHPGYVGVAKDLVQIAPEFDILVKFLLGNIIITSDIESADKISKVLEHRYMVVSLEGDIVRTGGVITGGAQQNMQSILGLDEKIEQLKNALPGIKVELQNLEAKQHELINGRNNLINLINNTKQQLIILRNKRLDAQKLYDEYNVRYNELGNKKLIIDEIKINEQSEIISKEKLESELLSLQSQLHAKQSNIQSLSYDIKVFERTRNDFQDSLNKFNKSYADKLANKEKAKIILDQSRERLVSEYKMTFESAQLEFKLEIDANEAEEIVKDLREQIVKLGSIDIESLEKLVEEEERYNKLSADAKELSDAKDAIVSAISELDKIIISRLTTLVEEVDSEFNNVFKTMFGGGQAKLFFDNPKDILNSGVDIQAQPPGKSIKNLKLFSGGEKSLIAISLLFGILKARPLPLCVLDEVEAALDEANVVRYAEYLQELKEKTQFLVITHRHGTMSRVNSLFAATMQNRGVTTFFSISMDDAKKLVDDEQKDVEDLEKGKLAKIHEEEMNSRDV
ncbi:Chromosome partition protein smc [Mycoplasmopsis meleagridis]|uniref:Chromosome partition protein Smc n=1 Tax=Mycoplasmopsis meleagridis ATCC 25294 TaxID=1264554 RepID=A0A0F5H0F2_9BACT|nr:AAA family ATPase [Mycoplasmopsis meleagridis]KKB26605.1 Chromosome partition protein smc [Mycoplasmopsis meleagridis ATCC 25294]KUH47430.1 ABC transporter ATP-binding protein [Mycoplasmopsis meleagridis]OAD18475.1 Chromosome partition protein smc [Mycoplasmopsis meleagridis]VEU77656.1 ABC transporter ATP-binding protein [Mycoplasmopsis meleagridis]